MRNALTQYMNAQLNTDATSESSIQSLFSTFFINHEQYQDKLIKVLTNAMKNHEILVINRYVLFTIMLKIATVILDSGDAAQSLECLVHVHTALSALTEEDIQSINDVAGRMNVNIMHRMLSFDVLAANLVAALGTTADSVRPIVVSLHTSLQANSPEQLASNIISYHQNNAVTNNNTTEDTESVSYTHLTLPTILLV